MPTSLHLLEAESATSLEGAQGVNRLRMNPAKPGQSFFDVGRALLGVGSTEFAPSHGSEPAGRQEVSWLKPMTTPSVDPHTNEPGQPESTPMRRAMMIETIVLETLQSHNPRSYIIPPPHNKIN